MTASIPSRSPFAPDEYPTPAERMHGFRVGEVVRVTIDSETHTGRVGVVDHVDGNEFGVFVAIDGQVYGYRPSELERAAGVFQRGDRVVLTYCDAEHPGTVTALSEMPGMRSVIVRFDEPDDDGETVGAVDPSDLRHETSGGGAVPSPAPPSDPSLTCGAVAPYDVIANPSSCNGSTPDQHVCTLPAGHSGGHSCDECGYALVAYTEADPADPASVGEVPPITPADIPGLYVVSGGTMVRPPDSARHRASSQAGLQSMKYAMDATHRAIDAGLAESRRLGDLDAAAQAIVDAADVWADAEGDVDATITLADAVQAWRLVRDGSRA